MKLSKLYNYKLLIPMSGFTLIELVIVLVVLSILTLIAIPRYYQVTDTAERAHNLTNANLLFKSWSSFEASNNGNDPTIEQLNSYLSGMTLNELPLTNQNTDGYIINLTYNGVTVPIN